MSAGEAQQAVGRRLFGKHDHDAEAAPSEDVLERLLDVGLMRAVLLNAPLHREAHAVTARQRRQHLKAVLAVLCVRVDHRRPPPLEVSVYFKNIITLNLNPNRLENKFCSDARSEF